MLLFHFRNMYNVAIGKTTTEKLKAEENNLCINRLDNDIAIVQVINAVHFTLNI